MKQLEDGRWVIDAEAEPALPQPVTSRSLADMTKAYMLRYYPTHSSEALGAPGNLDEAAMAAKKKLAERDKRCEDEISQAGT